MKDISQKSRNAKKAEKDSGNISVYTPYDSVAVPSSGMLAIIEQKLLILERAGIDTSAFRENKTYKRRYTEAKQMLRGLMKLVKENGLRDVECKTVYVNLCRNRKTKEKIKYRTSHRLGCPKGYEYIGTLSQETVFIEGGNESENGRRERDDNQLQPSGE